MGYRNVYTKQIWGTKSPTTAKKWFRNWVKYQKKYKSRVQVVKVKRKSPKTFAVSYILKRK